MSNPVYRELKRALILSPLAIPIGLVISFILLIIFLGDPGSAFGLMALSIICTAGISLIIWVPVWYLLGYMVIALGRMVLKAVGVDAGAMFGGSKPDNHSPATPTAESSLQNLTTSLDEDLGIKLNLTKDQTALIKYIRKAKQKGLSHDAITQNLSQNGWNIDSINQAFQLVGQE